MTVSMTVGHSPRRGLLSPALPWLAVASLALSGCGALALPDADLQAMTAAYLGQPVTQIYNRRSVGMSNTYYDVRTPRGQYSCIVNGTVAVAGMTCRPA